MSAHADRDRSDSPWWPPSATREPIITDEPQGDALPVDEERLGRYEEAIFDAAHPTPLGLSFRAILAQAAMGVADAEQAELRATLERVGALVDKWDFEADAYKDERPTVSRTTEFNMRELMAALAGPVEITAADGCPCGVRLNHGPHDDWDARPAEPEATDATIYASVPHEREIHTPDALEWPSKEDDRG